MDVRVLGAVLLEDASTVAENSGCFLNAHFVAGTLLIFLNHVFNLHDISTR